MPFRFVYLCDLLDALEQIATKFKGPTLLPKVAAKQTNDTMIQWFRNHRNRLNAFDSDGDAIKRSIWLQRDTGRVYGLDGYRLEHLVGRALALPNAKLYELQEWARSNRHGDLGACLERVMRDINDIAVRAQVNDVTVEEIDRVLLLIASQNRNSAPEVKSLASSCNGIDPFETLDSIYQRLQSREAKWLTRLILKDYGPIKIPEILNYGNSSLPNILSTQVEAPSSRSAAILREGTRIVRGSSNAEAIVTTAQQPPPSPPITPPEPTQQTDKHTPLCEVFQSSHNSNKIRQQISPSLTLQQPNKKISQPQPRTALQELSVNQVQQKPIKPAAPLSIPPPSNHYMKKGTGICTLTKNACPLENCIFLLGPCLSTVPYIIEDLLPFHGSTFITSLEMLSRPCLRRNTRTGKKYRKIVLIEMNRPNQTRELLLKIRAIDLKRRNGEKDWVEAYDWRLLEIIAKADQGKVFDYNPWKRCFLTAV